MLKDHKNLIKVKFDSAKDSDNSNFKREIKFYVKKIKKSHKIQDDIEERKDSCANEHLFKNLLDMIENKEEHEKMPVRKFFNNTFDTLINDAVFALKKNQRKSNNSQMYTLQWQIRFVAQFLQDNLPENELENMSEDDDEEEEMGDEMENQTME